MAFAFFSGIQTKFHHYILPAVPGMAVAVAFWLDDVWQQRARGTASDQGALRACGLQRCDCGAATTKWCHPNSVRHAARSRLKSPGRIASSSSSSVSACGDARGGGGITLAPRTRVRP
jgi:hypothetical protein